MSGKKLYAVFLVFMCLLAAFGLWVMTDSIIAYRQRPRVEDYFHMPEKHADILQRLRTGGDAS